VRVHHEEGVASHLGPEPCVITREGEDEASAGGAHRPAIDPRKKSNPGRRRISDRGRQHGRRAIASARALACVDAPCAGTGLPTNWQGEC
jgi:hypothetical protein